MATETIVRYEAANGIARVTLARPPVNALSVEMIRGVIAALRRASADAEVRAIVIASAVAKRFSAGLDIDILLGKRSEEIRTFVQELYINLHDTQYNLGKPSIAAVGGAARGGGMTLAISCDVLLAGQSATFGYPEIDVGLIPSIHFAHLPRIIGRHRAFELLFSGRAFDANEALALGLVSKVVPDAEFDAAAMELAATFASKSTTIVRMGRADFMRQNDLDYRRSIANAVEDFCNVAVTDDAQEGLRAFVEKRAPGWQQKTS
jgi:enoyl-CoA hydratase